MEEIPGNAHRQKQERSAPNNPEEVEREVRTGKVVEGEVIVRKRPLVKRFLDNFSGADGQSVGSFVWHDIMVPMTRDMLFDVINGGAQRAIFGNDARRPSAGGRSYGGAGYGAGPGVSYNARYGTPSPAQGPSISARGRAMQNFNEVMVTDRFKAEEVRMVLYELIDRYGYARVSDFYSAVGLSATHSDDKFGWDDLKGCKIRHVNGGYIIDLPQPVEIVR